MQLPDIVIDQQVSKGPGFKPHDLHLTCAHLFTLFILSFQVRPFHVALLNLLDMPQNQSA